MKRTEAMLHNEMKRKARERLFEAVAISKFALPALCNNSPWRGSLHSAARRHARATTTSTTRLLHAVPREKSRRAASRPTGNELALSRITDRSPKLVKFTRLNSYSSSRPQKFPQTAESPSFSSSTPSYPLPLLLVLLYGFKRDASNAA
eukprot:9472649-Pyramimonas_sp.AAC.1